MIGCCESGKEISSYNSAGNFLASCKLLGKKCVAVVCFYRTLPVVSFAALIGRIIDNLEVFGQKRQYNNLTEFYRALCLCRLEKIERP